MIVLHSKKEKSRNVNTDQIASEVSLETAKQLLREDQSHEDNIDSVANEIQPFVKCAIEKATAPLLTAIKTAINENDMMPLFMVLDEVASGAQTIPVQATDRQSSSREARRLPGKSIKRPAIL